MVVERSRSDPCSETSHAALPFLCFHSGDLLCKLSSNSNVTLLGVLPRTGKQESVFSDRSSLRSPSSAQLGDRPSFGHTPSPSASFLWIKKRSVAIVTFPGGVCHALVFSFSHLCHICSCDGCARFHSSLALAGLRKQHTGGFLSLPTIFGALGAIFATLVFPGSDS